MVASYLDAVTSLDTHDQAFTARLNDIAKLGDDDIRAVGRTSRTGCSTSRCAAMSKGGISEAGNVSRSRCSPCASTVEDLDPQQQGDLLSPRKLLGIIPFGDKVVDYFRKYQSSQSAHQRDHRQPVRRPGRAAPRQRRHRAGEGPTCGRRWAGCASTPTSPSSSTRR